MLENHFIEIQHSGLQHLAAREGQQLARQRGGAIGRAIDLAESGGE